MLQFAKRLAYHGLQSTLAITRSVLSSTKPETSLVHVAIISDSSNWDQTLSQLMEAESDAGRPIQVVIYDTFMLWAADVARRFGAATAAFFTQSCAVDANYGQVWEGKLEVPVQAGPVQLAGLPMLELGDLPSFVVEPVLYLAYTRALKNQFLGLDKADEALINPFSELEAKVSFCYDLIILSYELKILNIISILS